MPLRVFPPSAQQWLCCLYPSAVNNMAEQEPTTEQLAEIAAANEESEGSVNYKPPAQKSLQEIQELDKDDESLRRYKEALLGKASVVAGQYSTPADSFEDSSDKRRSCKAKGHLFQRSTCKQKMFLPDTHVPADTRHTHIHCNMDQKRAN